MSDTARNSECFKFERRRLPVLCCKKKRHVELKFSVEDSANSILGDDLFLFVYNNCKNRLRLKVVLIYGCVAVLCVCVCLRFEEENLRRLEQNQRCMFLSNAAMQWLDIRLQLIGVAVVTGIGVIAVVQHQFKSIDPGESTKASYSV